MHICGYGYDRGHLWCQIAGRDRYAARCEVGSGGDRPPPGGALTWGDALGGAGVLSSPRHRSMHEHALWTPRYARRHHSMLVPGSIVLGCGTVRLRPLPLRWLHHRQVMRVLSRVSVPPRL